MKLLIIGSVAYDSITTPFGKVDSALGGSATYFSLAASYFTQPSLVAVVGEDFKPAHEKIFAAHKIDSTGLQKQTGKTFSWGGKYSFDLNSRETLFTRLGVFENFKPELSARHKQSDYVFLGNIHPSLQLSVLKQITKPKFVGLDTMNYWIESAKPELQKVLRAVDILIINDSEARELSKEHNLLKGGKKILKLMKKQAVLVIKRGEHGLTMLSYNSSKKLLLFNLPGFPLEDVADPTGAGDSFAGGFFGHLAKMDSSSWQTLKQACINGSVMASFCVEKLGTAKLQNLKPGEIKKRLADFCQVTEA